MPEKLMTIDKKKLREIMDKKGIDRYTLLSMFNMSESSWFKYWRLGWPPVYVFALCHKLGVTEQYLGAQHAG